MNKFLTFLCCISLSTFAGAAEDTHSAITKKLSQLGLNASGIAESPIEGLYQVVTNRGLFYFSKNSQYLIQGNIYDLSNRAENITEKAMDTVRAKELKAFTDDLIVYPAKNEKHKITVFSDTTCGYCRKLHNQMDEYNDLGITVQYLAFPRSGPQGKPFDELEAIWCAANPNKAMDKVKGGGKISTQKAQVCDARIAEQYTLGVSVGVNATPAIILDDGTMMMGYQPPAQLLAALEDNVKNK